MGGLLQPPTFKSKSEIQPKKQSKEELQQEGIEVSESTVIGNWNNKICYEFFLEEPSQPEPKASEKAHPEENKKATAVKSPVSEEELPLVGKREGETFPPLESKEWELEGNSWTDASVDVVYAGLGWISVTGTGKIKVRAWGVKGTGLYLRDEPLMPFEAPAPDRNKVKPIKPN